MTSSRYLVLALLLAAPLSAQQTTPERTGGKETSSWADVTAFLDSLERRGAPFRFGTLGTSTEGRRIPFVIAAAPGVQGPADAQASGRVVVWLQANIHAGEVEGKEAAQMVLRDLAFGPAPSVARQPRDPGGADLQPRRQRAPGPREASIGRARTAPRSSGAGLMASDSTSIATT